MAHDAKIHLSDEAEAIMFDCNAIETWFIQMGGWSERDLNRLLSHTQGIRDIILGMAHRNSDDQNWTKPASL